MVSADVLLHPLERFLKPLLLEQDYSLDGAQRIMGQVTFACESYSLIGER